MCYIFVDSLKPRKYFTSEFFCTANNFAGVPEMNMQDTIKVDIRVPVVHEQVVVMDAQL